MAAKKNNPAMDFIVERLKKNPSTPYAEIAEAASKKKLTIYPIMFGRAQALLGIVKQSPRGQGKAARAKAEAAAGSSSGGSSSGGAMPVKRGPGRPRKNPVVGSSTGSFDSSLEGIVAAVKGSEQAKARYRAALERIQSILADALAN